ncbi:lactonase family protein [Actinoplanes sp. RD1]|uniref:lactonase family protein n=1 Tax=Actinoplanes sp. RD1 TaxID=3064538 RepID=UPI0027411CB7|nr:lactonase family protein [Actinoplanes sp. RD1]
MIGRLIAYIGCYSDGNPAGGGIHVLDVSADGTRLTRLSQVPEPAEAGFLAYAPELATLYAVDERKTDGRGPAGPAASVYAYAVDPADGGLRLVNSRTAPGAFPCYLTVSESRRVLMTANHGSFDHIERVVAEPGGGWTVRYEYDDSTVLLYDLDRDGALADLRDARVLDGHGPDPNGSPQVGGHGQASAHAHSAVLDPSGRYVLVCDKGTDQILVLSLDDGLKTVSVYQCRPETGPRHLVFDPQSGHAFVTCEFSSRLMSLAFDPVDGSLTLLDEQLSTAPDYRGPNEPADVRIHPGGRFVYVNNRGEDSLAWFAVGTDGRLSRSGHVALGRSLHPGVAARSFAFDPTGTFLLVADRPANLVRSFAVDASDGSLRPVAEIATPQPACVAFAGIVL